VIPKIHRYGTNFKGAALYVLHDKNRSETDERVDWVEARNLSVDTSTPRGRDIAWRIMAATSMDANRLKAEAGVKNTGRKSDDHVMHFTIGWHEDDHPTREEMRQSVDDTLDFLGATDRQALIVAHNDGKPHVHVIVNRVSTDDGRLLSKWRDRRKIQRWASEYERNKGVIRCPQRERNARRRDRGDYTWAAKDKPRHIFELERGSNDNSPRFERIQAQQKRLDTALSKTGRTLAQKHHQEFERLDTKFDTDRRKLLTERANERSRTLRQIRVRYRPNYDKSDDTHERLREFLSDQEADRAGQIQDLDSRFDPGQAYRDGSKSGLSSSFSGKAAEDAEKIREDQNYRARQAFLRARERTELRLASRRLHQRKKASLEALRSRQQAERSSLELRHRLETAKLRTQWRERNRQRKSAFGLLRAPDAREHFEQASANEPISKRTESDQRSPAPVPESARDKYIRKTTRKDDGKSLTRDEYVRKTREQDNDPDRRDPDRDR